MGLNEFIGVTTLLYALSNPIGVIPIFLGYTRKLKNIKPHRIIIIASISVAIFLVTCSP